MLTLKERLFKKEYGQISKQKESLEHSQRDFKTAQDIFLDAYYKGPAFMSPEALIAKLKELDSQYTDLILRRLQYGSGTIGYKATEADRLYYVDSSRRMYDNDVVTESIINIWNNFGFGLNVDIIPRNDAAKGFWAEFWGAERNSYVLSQRQIQDLSTKVLRDGDLLLLFFTSTLDGLTTLRIVESDKVKGGSAGDGIISLKDDAMVPVLYRKEVQANSVTEVNYYQDWRIDTYGAAQIEEIEDGSIVNGNNTIVRAMLIAHRVRDRRGWPLMTTGIPWSIAYRDFTQDMAAVAKAVSMYVDKLVVDSGQSAIDQITSRLQSSGVAGLQPESNPTPTAGSTWVENKAVTRERMPLSTGAGESDVIGSSLLGMAGLAGGIYPHWLGKGEAYRLATATSMEKPALRVFNRYQLFWSSVWQDVSKYVLTKGEKYGRLDFGNDYSVDVNTDSIIDTSTEDILRSSTALGSLYGLELVDQATAMEITEQLLRIMLQTVGVNKVSEIFESTLNSSPASAKLKDLVKALKSGTNNGTNNGTGNSKNKGTDND